MVKLSSLCCLRVWPTHCIFSLWRVPRFPGDARQEEGGLQRTRGVSLGPYLKTQEQGMKEATAVCSPGDDSQGRSCVKIQKDGKKNKEKKSEEEEKKGPQKIVSGDSQLSGSRTAVPSLARPRSQEGWVWRGARTTGEKVADMCDQKRQREKKMAGYTEENGNTGSGDRSQCMISLNWRLWLPGERRKGRWWWGEGRPQERGTGRENPGAAHRHM